MEASFPYKTTGNYTISNGKSTYKRRGLRPWYIIGSLPGNRWHAAPWVLRDFHSVKMILV